MDRFIWAQIREENNIYVEKKYVFQSREKLSNPFPVFQIKLIQLSEDAIQTNTYVKNYILHTLLSLLSQQTSLYKSRVMSQARC